MYLLGMREIMKCSEKMALFFRTVLKCELKSACNFLHWKRKEDECRHLKTLGKSSHPENHWPMKTNEQLY